MEPPPDMLIPKNFYIHIPHCCRDYIIVQENSIVYFAMYFLQVYTVHDVPK